MSRQQILNNTSLRRDFCDTYAQRFPTLNHARLHPHQRQNSIYSVNTARFGDNSFGQTNAMAEKRKLPARERREPAAKRRVSEATPQAHSSRRRKTSTPAIAQSPAAEPAREPTPEPVEEPLPTKIKDGEALPTRAKAQPSQRSNKDFQSIAERCVFL
jgi:hypothetical protein